MMMRMNMELNRFLIRFHELAYFRGNYEIQNFILYFAKVFKNKLKKGIQIEFEYLVR